MEAKVITLCGSTKFKKEFEEINARLTLEGNVVISVGVFGHADGVTISEEQKEMLDKIHLQKIDMADEIFVINVHGYIGSSTKNEIEYAKRMNKPVRYLEEVDQVELIKNRFEKFSQFKDHGENAKYAAGYREGVRMVLNTYEINIPGVN